MSFTPLKSRSRSLGPWFRTHPESFVTERSRPQMLFWAIAAAAMVVLALLVYLNQEATVELLGGRVRSGLAIAAAFVLPPVIFIVCIVMILRPAQRWRVRGGDVLLNPVVIGVDGRFPVQSAVAAIRDGGDDEIVSELTAAYRRLADARVLTVFSSEADQVMYIGVLRVDGNSVWIDEEPVRVDRFVDLRRLNAVALRASGSPANREQAADG